MDARGLCESLVGDANRAHEILLARPMLDQCDDDPVRPWPGVIDRQIVSVDPEELHHRHKASALVSLGEGMRPRNPGYQRHGQNNDVLFAKAEEIARAGQCAFKQSPVAEEMRFSGDCYDRSIDLDDCLYRQPSRLIQQGPPISLETAR